MVTIQRFNDKYACASLNSAVFIVCHYHAIICTPWPISFRVICILNSLPDFASTEQKYLDLRVWTCLPLQMLPVSVLGSISLHIYMPLHAFVLLVHINNSTGL